MTREQLLEFRTILEEEQAGTGRTLRQNRQYIVIDKSADVLEEISYTADRELAMARLSRHSGLLRDIRAALVRIENDEFGICICCETKIGLRRLRAVPWTPLCIRCQEVADQDGAGVLELVHEISANAA